MQLVLTKSQDTMNSHPAHNPGQRLASPSGEERERSEEHTSELQSQSNLVCRLLLEKKKKSRLIVRVGSEELYSAPRHCCSYCTGVCLDGAPFVRRSVPRRRGCRSSNYLTLPELTSP